MDVCKLRCRTWIIVAVCSSLVKSSGSVKHPLLLFATNTNITMMDSLHLLRESSPIISNQTQVAGLDYIFTSKSLFWTDAVDNKIKRIQINDTRNITEVVKTGLGSTHGLACDWLGMKLYWTDSENQRIEVSNLDGSYRKVLFWKNVDKPRAIAVDPLNGFMYWSDWGETPKIERAGMDGNPRTRQEIITKNIDWPNGLTLDYSNSIIYWTDGKLKSIFSANFDGSNRRTVIDGTLKHPFALSTDGETLFYTDWKTRSIHSLNIKTKSHRESDAVNLTPMDIKVYSANRQLTGKNPCGRKNGGCSHLCLISPIKPFYACACPTGVLILSDNKTCAGVENMLIIGQRQNIRLVILDTPSFVDRVLPINVSFSVAIDYDPTTSYLYWTQGGRINTSINRAYLNGSGAEVIVEVDVFLLDGIAVDWIGQNIYWSETRTNQIEVARTDGLHRRTLISENLDEPRALAVDPVAGYLYWTDWGENARIERSALDGSDRATLINTKLGWPNGLTLDYDLRKMYWVDAKMDLIEFSNMDGTERRTLVSENIPHSFAITLLGDYVYWNDWQKRTIERVNKQTGKNREVIIDSLTQIMGLKAANTKKAKGSNPCAVNNGGCSHLCLHRPNYTEPFCACPNNMIINGITCVKKTSKGLLIYSVSNSIEGWVLKTNQTALPRIAAGVKKAISIDYDFTNKRIYWIDAKNKSINSASIYGSSVDTIIDIDLEGAVSLAVDWMAGNLLWANMAKHRIEIARTSGSYRKILLWKNITEPRAIVLDPAEGYIYWAEWGASPHIERSNFAGYYRTILISNSGRVQHLTIDYIEKKMYWTDIDRETIESSNMLGEDRKVIVKRNVKKPMGLTQYEDTIYWTDMHTNTIESANKATGNNHTILHRDDKTVYDITIFHASRQSGWNGCRAKNGDCTELCLAHNIRESGKFDMSSCSCQTHYTWSMVNKTCSAPKTYLLISQKASISRLVIKSDESKDADYPEVVLPIHKLKNIKALAYDPRDKFVYWIDGRNKVVRRAHENGTHPSVVVNGNGIQPYDIAIDPYSRSIYWTCNKNNVINVSRLNSTLVGVVVTSDNVRPRSITLYPEKGYMYWTNMVGNPKIEKAAMDGTERTTLFESNLGHPLSLTVQKEWNKLCWADSGLKRIECADLGGGKRVVIERINEPKGLASYGRFLYLLDQVTMQGIERVNEKGRKSSLYARDTDMMQDLSDLISVDHNFPAINHPCAENNHGCSHICLATKNGTGRCGCPFNLLLAADERTCSVTPLCRRDQFTCRAGDVQCIPLLWQCDGVSECEDSSDEENCRKCAPKEFQCANEECILEDLVCDGIHHCANGSDEDDKLCRHNPPRIYLLLSQKTSISRLVMNSNKSVDNLKVLSIHNLKNVKALAYDPRDEFIYWIDGKSKVVRRAHENGTNPSVVVNENGIQPYDIAIDPYSRSIYWTCNKNNVINVSRLNSTLVGVVMSDRIRPRFITLYPEKGYMYWTNFFESPTIEKAFMDGTARTTLVQKGLEHPVSLVIDKESGRLCWADSVLKVLECVDLISGLRNKLVSDNIQVPRGLTIHGSYLYWVDRKTSDIERVNKRTGGNRTIVYRGLTAIRNLISVNQSEFWNYRHPCAFQNNGCSHICRVKANGEAQCACPVNLSLNSGGKSCVNPSKDKVHQFVRLTGDMRCVPLTWKCDKIQNCEGNENPLNCEKKCASSEFRCSNGDCIVSRFVCDGTRQCTNGSDETGCCEGDECFTKT